MIANQQTMCHSFYHYIGTMFVFRSQFTDNGNTVHNGIAGSFYLFNG